MALELYTTVMRTDADGDAVECPATVRFSIESYIPGYPATRTQPGEAAEFECAFEDAELDGKDTLTDAELATLRTWFAANTDRVWQVANDNYDAGPDPDDARDRANDEGWRGLAA
jgi:hypothetical protein